MVRFGLGYKCMILGCPVLIGSYDDSHKQLISNTFVTLLLGDPFVRLYRECCGGRQ